MIKRYSAALIVGTALVLAGCGKKDAAAELEKGQVVATVDGKDVTIHELNSELAGLQLPSGPQRQTIEKAALQQIVNRHILADIARDRGLDKTPMFLLQQRRANDEILVQMLQRQVSSQIKPPTRQEAEAFIAQHPEIFANRKVYTVDQIQFQAPSDPRQLAAYQPLKTMDEVEQQLIRDNLKYKRAPTTLDTLTANPNIVAQVQKLPVGEIFLIPAGRGVVTANRISDTKVVPLSGDDATQVAMQMVQGRKLQDLAKRELEPKVKKARDEVKYQPGYAPPKGPGDTAAPAAK